jgi:hypothetical protein
MLSSAEIQNQLRVAESNRASSNTRLASIDQKISEVKVAITEIAQIKELFKADIEALKAAACDDTGCWRGSIQRKAWDEYGSSLFALGDSNLLNYGEEGYQNTGSYWDRLDNLADDLEDSLTNLLSQRVACMGDISEYSNLIYWLRNQWNKLSN